MIKVIEENGENSEGYATYNITIEKDGKVIEKIDAWPLWECPEDACLERDLDYVYQAINFFKLGYEAGKRGEEVKYE